VNRRLEIKKWPGRSAYAATVLVVVVGLVVLSVSYERNREYFARW
jgi:hypothetical protein